MEIRNQHERIVAAAPERISELIADFDRIWPTQIAPVPRLLGPGTYDAGIMVWEEFDRPGAARAFRVTRPDELRAEHWFELRPADGVVLVRHTIEGSAAGRYETIWRERIEPLHHQILEALLDNIEAAATLADGAAALASSRATGVRWPSAAAALTCEKEYIEFRAADGAGEHCESGARTLFHQRAFDWLDAVPQPRAEEPGGVSGARDRALLTPPA